MMLFGHDSGSSVKAFAVYGAAAAAGGTAGAFLGGVITESAAWPWVSSPTSRSALAVLAAIPALMPRAGARHGSLDQSGAVTATAGLTLTASCVVRAPSQGWDAEATVLSIAGGMLWLVLFVALQAVAASL